ncbi:TAXI family TRAP transporter solute-binding subunit [Streptomyces sp. DSM 42041]|uniref:TAXI family TRAP transporter solute-binding subunit n=1 Tax=Streptomyces hazeniae TaxID=3075538 RepID=A0ABU2NZ57_9ACTN|nr:TAXI family TRAP transporter solute-binding subunit [Streptomyces sp. DSM 42041]MDT0382265.1 TAXI family TRAP transporter solute-binding subunit [Streptomyces sp. DSM 42041]
MTAFRFLAPRPGVPGGRALGGAALLVVLGLLAWWLVPAGPAQPRGTLTFATGVPTGVYQQYGSLLKQRLARDVPGLSMELVPSQGSVQNIDMLVSGEADFTIAQSDAVAAHLKQGGEGGDGLRAVARLYDDYMQLVVPAESPVREARDLRGLRVGMGEERSGVSLVAGRLLEAAGLDREQDIDAVPAGIDVMPGMLESGELDAFFWSGGLPTGAIEDLAVVDHIRLVPLGALMSRLHRMEPETRHYRAAVMPGDAYPSVQQGEPVDTIAVSNLLVTTADADPAVTEALTRSLIRSRDTIGQRVHAAQKVDLRTAIYTDPLRLHTGAQRYYRAVKP